MRTGKQRGVALLGVLVLLAIVPMLLLAAVELWDTRVQRQRETELLFVGDQIARALVSYRNADPTNVYPKSLSELVRDRRGPGERHHLRQLYRDPMTNSTDWGLVLDPDQRIFGVYSRSKATPFKIADFPARYKDFETRTRFRDWEFNAALAETTPDKK